MMSVGLIFGGIVEWRFIQKMDSETLICGLKMPVGTTAANVKRRLMAISDHVTGCDPLTAEPRFPEVSNVQMHVARQYDVTGIGSTGSTNQSHLGQLIIELHLADERERNNQRSSEQLLAAFRDFCERSGELTGVNSINWEGLSGGPGGKGIHIRVSGKNFAENVLVAERLKTILSGYDGVFDLDDNHDKGKQEVQLRLWESARPTGITVDILGGHVRSAMYGREARRITRNREDVRIMIRYPEDFRRNIYNLESMWVPTGPTAANRGWVPLREVAEMTEAESYNTIHRSQQERSVTVFGEIDQEVAEPSEILGRIRQTFDTQIKNEHPGVRIEFLGSTEEMKKAFGGLKVAMPVALLLIYMLLAGLFQSYFQPLVVMSAIPFGFMGAVAGHWILNCTFTILSSIGMVALTGILVNDSLVLVDFINKRMQRGLGPFEASIQGAKLRLRAILLTTLTTVAGLAPLMFETSFQAKFLIPMTVTLTFGLIFATALTLVIVPSLNMIYFDCLSVVRGKNN